MEKQELNHVAVHSSACSKRPLRCFLIFCTVRVSFWPLVVAWYYSFRTVSYRKSALYFVVYLPKPMRKTSFLSGISIFCHNHFCVTRSQVNHFKSVQYLLWEKSVQLQGGRSTSWPERRQSDAWAAGRTSAGRQLRFVFQTLSPEPKLIGRWPGREGGYVGLYLLTATE